MRPVNKGVRTPQQYLGGVATRAYAAAGGLAGAGPILAWLGTVDARANDYRDAKEHLTATIGEYCSFCERRIPAKLDVEHMAPKDTYTASKFEWGNFLLACGNCNSVKLTKHKVRLLQGGYIWNETTEVTYCFWPDRLAPERAQAYGQDSYNVFRYSELGLVSLNPSIPDGPTRDRALSTLAITGIDRVLDATTQKIPSLFFRTKAAAATQSQAETWDNLEVSGLAPSLTLMTRGAGKTTPALRLLLARDQTTLRGSYTDATAGRLETKDYRALHRSNAWDKAEDCRLYFDKLLAGNPINFWDTTDQGLSLAEFNKRIRLLTNAVIDLALATGFWSVWITVFKARGANTSFHRRPAVIPVLERLIEKFPGTRPNTDFNPLIYTPQNEADWTAEITAKTQQQALVDNARLRREQAVLALEDDVELLHARVHRLQNTRDDLEDDLDVEQRRADRYRRERNEALDDVDRLRDDRDHERRRRQDAEFFGNITEFNNRQLTRERDEARNAAGDLRRERDEAANAARRFAAQRDEAANAARRFAAQRDEAVNAAQQRAAERNQAQALAAQRTQERDTAANAARAAIVERDLAYAEIRRLRGY